MLANSDYRLLFEWLVAAGLVAVIIVILTIAITIYSVIWLIRKRRKAISKSQKVL